MMFEGRSLELLIAGVVLLIFVGPKDLPIVLRKFGQFVAKLRGMANEFRASLDDMARQSELDELRKEVEALRRGQLADPVLNSAVQDIHQELSDVGVQLQQPTDYGYADPPPPVEISKAPEAEAAPAPKTSRARKSPAAAAQAADAPAKRAPSKAAPSKSVAAKSTPSKSASAKSAPAKRPAKAAGKSKAEKGA